MGYKRRAMRPLSLARALPVLTATCLLAEAAPAQTLVAEATLPRDLSPLGMFQSADVVVQAVMLGLVAASVLCWTIWLAKSLELLAGRRALRQALPALESARSLTDASAALHQHGPAAELIGAAQEELALSADTLAREGVKERIQSRLERLQAAAARNVARGTGILASVGATAPFVGLFGTVWGIMNSFIGISKAQTTNLAVVAPGIAEALLATAFGLAAALPAVLMYNMFSRWTAAYRAQYGDLTAAVLRLVSRDLDRSAAPAGAARPLAAE
jgi:biopolymer transport protein ExbB